MVEGEDSSRDGGEGGEDSGSDGGGGGKESNDISNVKAFVQFICGAR